MWLWDHPSKRSFNATRRKGDITGFLRDHTHTCTDAPQSPNKNEVDSDCKERISFFFFDQALLKGYGIAS